jgi:RNA polymerase sigma factor (TIGR02999 family)
MANDDCRPGSAVPNARLSAEKILPAVYEELRRLAAIRLAQEKPGQILQPTALVHEAYLRLVDSTNPVCWDHQGHFFAAAAEAMRRILVEQARRRGRLKHGGGQTQVELRSSCAAETPPTVDLLALDEALNRLAAQHPEKAELVKLRYFGGLTISQAARSLAISHATAERHWAFARGWLYVELADSAETGDRRPKN